MTINMNSKLKAVMALAIAVTAVSAGAITLVMANHPNTLSDSFLSTFRSYEELSSYLKSTRDSRLFYGNGSEYAMNEGATSTDARSQTPYSKTNVQVQGVDEDDTMKTDGRFLYISSGDRVSIVEAYPPENLRNVSVIEAKDLEATAQENSTVWISGLFVYPGKLIVIGYLQNYYPWIVREDASVYIQPASFEPRATVYVFDITNASDPRLEMSVGVSGYPTTARMIGDFVYLIDQAYVWQYNDQVLVPKLWQNGVGSDLELSNIMYDPTAVYPSAFVNVLAVDITNGDSECKSIIAGYASTVYMSHQSLYVSFQKWSGDVILVNDTATPEDESGTRTTIYKLAVDELSMEPVARGEVKGWLLNQFSMDESAGNLRVATTTGWGSESLNSVYVLGANLTIVGVLTDLAPSESIYAARFIGDILYLVTFRQIDPLFVIDLRDPTNPKVLGELVMPGFSTYLHPVDETHVLGIGQENWSVKISLFDVSDPMNPVEQSKFVLETTSYSLAGWDHKAVLFDLSKELLVIPVESYTIFNDTYGAKYTSGAYVFRVSIEDGISLRGFVTHDMPSYYWSGWVQRSAFIGDYLYTISYSLLKVNSLLDLSEVGSLVYYVPSWMYATYDDGTTVAAP